MRVCCLGSVSIASTVVLMRELADHGLLNMVHGRVATGRLVLENLATGRHPRHCPRWWAVAIMAAMVTMAAILGFSSGRAHCFDNGRLCGDYALLGARCDGPGCSTKLPSAARELFILAIVALALGTAFGAAELFGVSNT